MTESFWIAREAGVGSVSLVLGALAVALGRYIYYNLLTSTRVQRDARNIAIGLFLIFLVLSVRGLVSWGLIFTMRRDLDFPMPLPLSAEVVELVTAVGVLLGAFLCLYAFRDFIRWALTIVVLIVIPVVLAFI